MYILIQKKKNGFPPILVLRRLLVLKNSPLPYVRDARCNSCHIITGLVHVGGSTYFHFSLHQTPDAY